VNIKQNIKLILKRVFNFDIKLYKQKSFYKKLIQPNSLCFDIGANIGDKSKIFLYLNARVIAFEPQSQCYIELKKILHNNFKFLPYAIGAKNETKNLRIANHIEVATFSEKMIDFYSNKNLKWSKTEKVTVKKLDTIIEEFGVPDFCKIDTEGFELEILSKLTYAIPMIEFEFVEAFIFDTLGIITILNKEGTLYNYNLNEKPKFELKEWVNAKKMIRIIKNIPKSRLHGNIFVKNI